MIDSFKVNREIPLTSTGQIDGSFNFCYKCNQIVSFDKWCVRIELNSNPRYECSDCNPTKLNISRAFHTVKVRDLKLNKLLD